MSRELHRAMDVVEVPVGSTGTVLERTLVHNGTAIDISGATGDLLYNAKTKGGAAVVTSGVATETTDGTDGKVRFTLPASLVGSAGDHIVSFEQQGYNSGNLVSFPFILRALPTGKGV